MSNPEGQCSFCQGISNHPSISIFRLGCCPCLVLCTIILTMQAEWVLVLSEEEFLLPIHRVEKWLKMQIYFLVFSAKFCRTRVKKEIGWQLRGVVILGHVELGKHYHTMEFVVLGDLPLFFVVLSRGYILGKIWQPSYLAVWACKLF